MSTSKPFRRRGERGLTLVEILVGVAILAVAATIALTVYDVSRKSFKKGENRTEQQQSVRIAFDKMTADLRMTGFNYNPDGAAARNDEQIEAAYDTAIVIRADFDAEDPTDSITPEATLGGSTYLSVSTGNDEIAAYVLAKPDGSSSNNLVFRADISNPRDGTLETVNIPDVALVQDDPPYTLYRITFNNDDSTHNTSAFFTRTPLIENVYSMQFQYFDQVNTQINAGNDPADVADDIGGLDTVNPFRARNSIRRFGLELVGMTEDPEPDWVDVDDPISATQSHRKFALTSEVVPRNIGMIGIKDISADVTPPSKPGTPTLTAGHCGGLWVTWPANPSSDLVSYYRVTFGTTSGSLGQSRTSASTSTYIGGLLDAQTYYVAVQAVDTDGNVSVPSTEASEATSNVNTPLAPENVAGSSGLTGVVEFTWDKVRKNSAALPAADPYAPLIRDLDGYRVYRGTSASFAQASLVADEGTLGNSRSSYVDESVVNCRSYNYWVQAVDECGTTSGESLMASGASTTDVAPIAPANVQAFLAGGSTVDLQWDPVVEDVDGKSIYVDTYNVYKSQMMPIGVIPTEDSAYVYAGTAAGQTTYQDNASLLQGYTIYYRVSATDDCNNESVMSEPAYPTCAFTGDVVFDQPNDGEAVAGVVPIQVSVLNGATDDTYTQMELEFTHKTDGSVTTQTIVDPGPTWTYDWLANPPGPYAIKATVTTDLGCSKSATISVAAGYDVGCCLSQRNPDITPIVLTCEGSGNAKCADVQYEIINNNCLTAVQVDAISVDWRDVAMTSPLLQGVSFDGSRIWNVTPPSAPPAATSFTDPKPTVAYERNSSFPVVVLYEYSQNMATKQGQNYYNNTLTTTYDFTLLDATGAATAITGSCGPANGWFNSMVVENP